MPGPLHITLEFARAESAGQPHGFRFAPQPYLLRTAGGGFETAEFPWTRAVLEDLRALTSPAPPPEIAHRIGELLREFLSGAGWSNHEQAIVAAARVGTPIFVTIRSAAAELYALPWELLVLKGPGQMLGGVPGLVVRHEWPETTSFTDSVPPPARRGRVLFAWSAAGGAVPAADHLAVLQRHVARFDPDHDVLPHASYAAIADALAAADPPVDLLHILCHGAPTGGTYGLALDDQSPGGKVIVDAGRIQQLVAPHAGMLRTVLVAACDSGNVGELGNHLGSVAQMIHRGGLHSVVASRFPLSAAGSSRFCAALYATLATGGTLERAFVRGREALVRDPSQLDWASVQLYARAADGEATHPLGRPPTAPRRRLAAGLTLAAAALALVAWQSSGAPEPAVAPDTSEPAVAPDAPTDIVDPTTKPPIAPTPSVPDPSQNPDKPPDPVKPRPDPPTKKPARPTPDPPKPPRDGLSDERRAECIREVPSFLRNALDGSIDRPPRPALKVRLVDGRLKYSGDQTYAALAADKVPELKASLADCAPVLATDLKL